jgi:serine protease Do
VLAVIVGGKQTMLGAPDVFDRIVAELKEGQQLSLLVLRGEASSFVSLRAGN